MHSTSYAPILQRINAALEASRAVFARFTPGAIETEYKAGHDPVTEADRALDAVLRKELLRDGEGLAVRRKRGRSHPPATISGLGGRSSRWHP